MPEEVCREIEVPQCHDHPEQQCHTLQVIIGLIHIKIDMPLPHPTGFLGSKTAGGAVPHPTGYFRVYEIE